MLCFCSYVVVLVFFCSFFSLRCLCLVFVPRFFFFILRRPPSVSLFSFTVLFRSRFCSAVFSLRSALFSHCFRVFSHCFVLVAFLFPGVYSSVVEVFAVFVRVLVLVRFSRVFVSRRLFVLLLVFRIVFMCVSAVSF